MKIGDCVVANSGGPKMTVEKSQDDMVWCFWFDGTKIKRSSFPVGGVKLYEDNPKLNHPLVIETKIRNM